LTKPKKKGIKTADDAKHDAKSEGDKAKDIGRNNKFIKGGYCSDCGGKRSGYSSEELTGVDTKFKSKEANKAETKDTKDNSGDSLAGHRDWSKEQDQMIRAMKSENKTWKEIGAAVGVSKKEAQQRFRVLQPVGQADGMTNVKDNGSKTSPSGLGITEVDTAGIDFSGLFLDDDSGVDGGVSGNDALFSTLTGYDGYRGNKKKSKKDDKKKTHTHNVEIEDTGSEWYEISPDGSCARQQSKMAESHLRPDEIWSPEDCQLLEELEANYRKTKWLHMQAHFFNWSGRMVDSSIIERKFKEIGIN
jgi:hypothetical protein